MAETIANIVIPDNSYVSVNSLSGITVGDGIIIQNKGNNAIYVQTGSQPSASSTEGYIVKPKESLVIDVGEPETWVRSERGSNPAYVGLSYSIAPQEQLVERRNFLTFDGVATYGEIPTWSPSGDFEVEGQFSTTYSAAVQTIVSKELFLKITVLTDGKLKVLVGDGSGWLINGQLDSINSFNDGILHNFTAVKSGNNYSLEVDGVLEASTINAAVVTPQLDFIGQRGTSVDWFNGVIANLRLTDHAGGDNRFYKLDGGRFGSGAYELDSLQTLGSELVTNGTFDTDTVWVKDTGWSISAGEAFCDGSQTSNSFLDQQNVLIAGKTYILNYEIKSYASGTIQPFFGSGGAIGGVQRSSTGTFSETITAPTAATDNDIIRFLANSDFIGSIDNVSVREAPNAMGLNSVISSDWEKLTKVGLSNDWLGDELVVNGRFDTDSDWTSTNDATGSWVTSSGKASVNCTSNSILENNPNNVIVTGHRYKTAFTILDYISGSCRIRMGTGLGTGRTANGTFTELIVGTANALNINFEASFSSGFNGSVDDVSVRRILEAP